MKPLVILALITLPGMAISQTLSKADSLQARLKTLENLQQCLESEQLQVEKQIEAVKDQIQLLTEQKGYSDGKLMVKCKGGYLMTTPSFDGDMIVQVPGGAMIGVFPDYYHKGYMKATYLAHEGFIYEVVLHSTPELDVMIDRLARKERQQQEKVSQEKAEQLKLLNTPRPASRSNSYRSTSRSYYTGPRGGCYYISSSGKKVYMDRSLCH